MNNTTNEMTYLERDIIRTVSYELQVLNAFTWEDDMHGAAIDFPDGLDYDYTYSFSTEQELRDVVKTIKSKGFSPKCGDFSKITDYIVGIREITEIISGDIDDDNFSTEIKNAFLQLNSKVWD